MTEETEIDAPVEVWVITGEEGHVYGIEATEEDAWNFVGREARQGMFECSDALPEGLTSADDVQVHWLIRSFDGSRVRELLAAPQQMHDLAKSSTWGAYTLTPVALPASLFGGKP